MPSKACQTVTTTCVAARVNEHPVRGTWGKRGSRRGGIGRPKGLAISRKSWTRTVRRYIEHFGGIPKPTPPRSTLFEPISVEATNEPMSVGTTTRSKVTAAAAVAKSKVAATTPFSWKNIRNYMINKHIQMAL